MLQLNHLTETLSVSGQPEPSDMAMLADQGFKVVICNRPDGEAVDQPSMADMKAAAEAVGMTFIGYPVNPGTFPGDDLAGLGSHFDGDEKVFAYCRTGTRCANLWVATREPEEQAAAINKAQSLGYDLSLVARLL